MCACPYECVTTLAPLLMQPGEVGSADHTGVVDQFGDGEHRLRVVTASRQMREIGLADGVEQQVAGYRHSPAEDEQLGVENRTERGAGLAEPAPEFPERLQRAGVVRGDQSGDVLAGQGAGCCPHLREAEPDPSGIRNLVRHPQQGTPGTVLFYTAPGAASAGDST